MKIRHVVAAIAISATVVTITAAYGMVGFIVVYAVTRIF